MFGFCGIVRSPTTSCLRSDLNRVTKKTPLLDQTFAPLVPLQTQKGSSQTPSTAGPQRLLALVCGTPPRTGSAPVTGEKQLPYNCQGRPTPKCCSFPSVVAAAADL